MMKTLQSICLSKVLIFVEKQEIKVEQLKVLPSSLLEQVCRVIPHSIQIRVLDMCVFWNCGVMRERGHYKNSRLSGELLKWDQEARVIEEAHFMGGKRHGRYIRYNPTTNSVKSVQNYSLGLLHGESILYDEVGKVSKVEVYKRGKRHGEKLVFFEDGDTVKKRTLFYRGKKEGYSRVYNKKSEVIKEILWVRGIRLDSSR